MHFQPDNAVKGRRSECFPRYYNIISPQERCLKDSWRRKGSMSSSIINQWTWKVLVGTEIQILPSSEKWLFCYKSAPSKLWWFDMRTVTKTTNTHQGSGFFLPQFDCVFKFPSIMTWLKAASCSVFTHLNFEHLSQWHWITMTYCCRFNFWSWW